MIPVFLFDSDGRHGLSVDEFEKQVLHICDDHQRTGRACAFAFILHDAESPQFSKVLGDRDYWIALDSISGTALTVFSVFAGYLRQEDSSTFVENVSRSRAQRGRQLHIVKTHFGLEDFSFPALLFFQVDNGSVIGARLVALKARDTECGYRELSEWLKAASNAVRDSTGRRIRDPERAFSKIEMAIRGRSTIAVGKEIGRAVAEIKDWLSLLIR